MLIELTPDEVEVVRRALDKYRLDLAWGMAMMDPRELPVSARDEQERDRLACESVLVKTE